MQIKDFMVRSLDTIKYNIRLKELWIEQRLAESIAENLRRDFAYDVVHYVKLSYEVMLDAGINRTWARKIITPAINQAYELNSHRIRTGEYAFHNGSGAHPSIVIGDECENLVSLARLMMTASLVAISHPEEGGDASAIVAETNVL